MSFDFSAFLPFLADVGTRIVNIYRSFTINFGNFSINGFTLAIVILIADYIMNLWEER